MGSIQATLTDAATNKSLTTAVWDCLWDTRISIGVPHYIRHTRVSPRQSSYALELRVSPDSQRAENKIKVLQVIVR